VFDLWFDPTDGVCSIFGLIQQLQLNGGRLETALSELNIMKNPMALYLLEDIAPKTLSAGWAKKRPLNPQHSSKKQPPLNIHEGLFRPLEEDHWRQQQVGCGLWVWV
jgi:hypothetical protein